MLNIYEVPTIEQGDGLHTDTVERHPSYAQIGASRVTGEINLYGSDFTHHSYVSIRISKSELHRNLSHDWPFARGEYIEVSLSEAQWARFVSAMNVGEGVQCTVSAKDGLSLPQIPEPPRRVEQFTSEVDRDLEKAVAALKTLRAKVGSQKLSLAAKNDLVGHVDKALRELTSGLPFVATSFAEHVERTTEKAKIEVSAYVQNTIVRAGLASILGSAVPFELPASRDAVDPITADPGTPPTRA